MRILCVCDKGVNRSVTFASLLKFEGHDTLAAGLSTAAPSTLELLYEWADKIILTERCQVSQVRAGVHWKCHMYDVGPDTYPRPFNKTLLRKARALLAEDPVCDPPNMSLGCRP